MVELASYGAKGGMDEQFNCHSSDLNKVTNQDWDRLRSSLSHRMPNRLTNRCKMYIQFCVSSFNMHQPSRI